MNVIFAGTPEFAATALTALIQAPDIHVKAVYTQPDRPAGRGQKLTTSPVKALALGHQLPIYQPLHFKKNSPEGESARAELATLCQQNAIDVMVVAAYGLILPQAVLDQPGLGCLNIHASLLPRWRGAAPIHRALLAGDPETGITIMQMDAGLDTGDILLKSTLPITGSHTAQSLHDQLADQGAMDILTALRDLTHYQARAQPQSDTEATYAHKLVKDEGSIDWHQPASVIERQVRGLQPWPVAFTTHGDERLRIWQAQRLDQHDMRQAGLVIATSKHGVDVICGDGTLVRLTQIQWAGGKPLDAQQIYNVNRLNVGDRLGVPL